MPGLPGGLGDLTPGLPGLGKRAPSPADLPDLQDLPAAFKLRGPAKGKDPKRK